jgi:hypothetical protein
VLPFRALSASLDFHCADCKVDVVPFQVQRFALSQSESEGDRPAGAIPAIRRALALVRAPRILLLNTVAGSISTWRRS